MSTFKTIAIDVRELEIRMLLDQGSLTMSIQQEHTRAGAIVRVDMKVRGADLTGEQERVARRYLAEIGVIPIGKTGDA